MDVRRVFRASLGIVDCVYLPIEYLRHINAVALQHFTEVDWAGEGWRHKDRLSRPFLFAS